MADGNIEFILNNIIADTNISASPLFDSKLPISYIAVQDAAYIARSVNNTDVTITINLTSARSLNGDGLALLGDFSESATLRMRCYSGLSGTGGSPLYDSGVMEMMGGDTILPTGRINTFPAMHFYSAFSSANSGDTYFSIIINLSDTNPPNGRHLLRRAVLGEVFSPRVNPTYESPWSYTLVDTSTIERNDTNDARTKRGYQQRQFQVPLDLSEAERQLVVESWRVAKTTNDGFIMLCPDSAGQTRIELGMNSFCGQLQFGQDGYNRNQLTLTFLDAMPNVTCLRSVTQVA